MARQIKETKEQDVSGRVDDLAAWLLPVVAREKIAEDIPVRTGASFFYEVAKGWETDMLSRDADVCLVRNVFDLEHAFRNEKIKTILVPYDASITKVVALRFCRRYTQGKTIFFET